MEKETEKDAESAEVKLPYPKAVLFIITTEFCERFSYYGMKGDLSWDLGPRILAKVKSATNEVLLQKGEGAAEHRGRVCR